MDFSERVLVEVRNGAGKRFLGVTKLLQFFEDRVFPQG